MLISGELLLNAYSILQIFIFLLPMSEDGEEKRWSSFFCEYHTEGIGSATGILKSISIKNAESGAEYFAA